jgi:hypothetical protein
MPAMASRTLLALTLFGIAFSPPRALAQPAPPVESPVPPAAAQPTETEPAPPVDATASKRDAVADAVLERILRSGCRDGLPDLDALVAEGDTPWSRTVRRLCNRILAKAAASEALTAELAAASVAASRREASSQEGRGRLVLWSSLYGIWLGIATDVLFGIDSERAIILPPLLGMGAGLSLSLALTSGVPISTGQAWTIITGLDYGSFNGALWAGSFDLDSKGAVGTAVASSVAATSIAIAVADAKNPSAGSIEVVRSSLLWGTVAGSLGLATFTPRDTNISQEGALRTIAITMDASFLVGLALARNLNLSRNRVLIIDAGAIGGAMTGLGLAWLASSDPDSDARVITGGGLVGLLAGIGIAAYFTAGMDDRDDDDKRQAKALVPPGLFALDAGGRWHVGTPGPMPVFDGTGRHVIGATVNALSGSF